MPKVLFFDPGFAGVSTDAKLLYGILLDRMDLSAKNQWLDEDGRVYIIFTIEEIQNALGCADRKATKLLDELEKKCGLIERRRRGLGRPNLIYVKNFTAEEGGRFQNREKHDSGAVEITGPEPSKQRCNHTDLNNTDLSHTHPIQSAGSGWDGEGRYRDYHRYFYEQLNMDTLYGDNPYDAGLLDNILELIVETMCSSRKVLRIASDDKPVEVVRSRLMKLDRAHIQFVLTCFRENTTKIRNIRQYLLASIYNAPVTMEGYYDAQVRHDMAHPEEGRESE